MLGDLELTVEFSGGSLAGAIVRLRVRGPGEDNYALAPASQSFEIADGRIVNGQFTATLTEVNPTGSELQGGVLGEFYGPAAEEVGGVLSGTSLDEVMTGYFGGKRYSLDPVTPQGTLSPPLSAVVNRDYIADAVQQDPDSRITAIQSDGADGFNVTYVIDGQEEMVHLRATDVTRFNQIGIVYRRPTADGRGLHVLNEVTGSFSGSPDFSYLDINGWGANGYAADGTISWVKRGFLSYGVATDVADLPTGTATYSGHAAGEEWNGVSFNRNRGSFTGNLSLMANFDANSVNGSITGIQYRPPGESDFVPGDVSLSLDNGSISGSGFSAELTGTPGQTGRYEGTANGQFYGPAAAEVGGVFQGTHTGEGTVFTGWFGGEKQ